MRKVKMVFLAALVVFMVIFFSEKRAPAQEVAEGEDLLMKIQHLVKPGESLSMLAGYYYRSGRKWKRIYENNMDKIQNPNLIHPGQVLIIRIPRNWEPPMSYYKWYKAMRGTGTGKAPLPQKASIPAKASIPTEAPPPTEAAPRHPRTRVERVKKKLR